MHRWSLPDTVPPGRPAARVPLQPGCPTAWEPFELQVLCESYLPSGQVIEQLSERCIINFHDTVHLKAKHNPGKYVVKKIFLSC